MAGVLDIFIKYPDDNFEFDQAMANDLFEAFTIIRELSLKFLCRYEKIGNKHEKCCEIQCDTLISLLNEKPKFKDNSILFLTKYLNWIKIFELFFKPQYFSQLKSLKVSSLQSIKPDTDIVLCSILNFEQLESLCIQESRLQLHKDQLHFWGVPNLIDLDLQSNELTHIPASICVLSHLETLNLNNNKFNTSSFPFSLIECKKLRKISFFSGSSSTFDLPYIIQKMQSLEEFTNTTNKYAVMSYQLNQGKIICSYIKPNGRFKPLSLQILSSEVVLSIQPNAWQERNLAPLLCRVLDRAIETCQLCFACNNVYPLTSGGYNIVSVLPTFLGNTVVQFQEWCCSETCKEMAINEQKDLNATLNLVQELEYSEVTGIYSEEAKQYENEALQNIKRAKPRYQAKKCEIS